MPRRKYERHKTEFHTDAKFAAQRLEWHYFDDCHYGGSTFDNCDWIHCRFYQVSFGSRYSNCQFIDCNLWGGHSHLGPPNTRRAVPSLYENCRFYNCVIDSVMFDRTRFRHCVFSGLFINVTLRGPEFPQEVCRFENVDLSGVRIEESDHVGGFDFSTTILPPGLTPDTFERSMG